MKHLTDEHGAAFLLELVLVGVVLVAVGLAVYGSLHTKNANKAALKTSTSPNVSPSPLTRPDPYAGWKSITIPYEQATFRYPSDWSLTQKHQPLAPGGPDVETDTVSSPDGLELVFSSPVQGIGGACAGNDCPMVTRFSTTKVKIPNVTYDTYILVDQAVDNGGAITRRVGLNEYGGGHAEPPTLGTYRAFYQPLSILDSHGVDHFLLNFGGGYKVGSSQNNLSYDQYSKLPSVQTATKILGSLTFKTPEPSSAN